MGLVTCSSTACEHLDMCYFQVLIFNCQFETLQISFISHSAQQFQLASQCKKPKKSQPSMGHVTSAIGHCCFKSLKMERRYVTELQPNLVRLICTKIIVLPGCSFPFGILSEIALNLRIHFGKVDIFTILNLPVQECERTLHVLKSLLF